MQMFDDLTSKKLNFNKHSSVCPMNIVWYFTTNVKHSVNQSKITLSEHRYSKTARLFID
jgi:hypothetical protein